MIFLDTLQGKTTSRPPIWFMRQAGRVLPNYMKIRENYSFKQMMEIPALAAEVTNMPLYDLGTDAAILFSDILVIPEAMGMGLEWTDHGPLFTKALKDMADPLKELKPDASKLQYIYNNIDEIIRTKPADIPLIGFCGAPFTTLCYMIQGKSTNHTFDEAVHTLYANKALSVKLLDAIAELSVEYALNQIKHGVQAFQLFETHAGLIPNDVYFEMIMPAVRKIGNAVRSTGTPFIFFPKGLGAGYSKITRDDCDFVSIDWQTSLPDARKMVDPKVGLQGNLDPRILTADQATIAKTLEKYIEFGSKNQNWIFNLGHGLVPGIPYENAKFVVDWVKNADWRR